MLIELRLRRKKIKPSQIEELLQQLDFHLLYEIDCQESIENRERNVSLERYFIQNLSPNPARIEIFSIDKKQVLSVIDLESGAITNVLSQFGGIERDPTLVIEILKEESCSQKFLTRKMAI